MTKYNKESTLKLARRLMRDRIMFPPLFHGKLSITQKTYVAGRALPVVDIREALFSGRSVVKLQLKESTVIHKLECRDNGTWMSDLPCELVQIWRDLAVRARGRVLIGGLGLGVVARMVAQKPCVTSIHVVERDPDVIALIASYLYRDFDKKIRVIQADIHKFTAETGRGAYDCALLDTWQGTGEWAWQTEVVPLRRSLGGKIRRTYCWGEAIMTSQVAQGLFRVAEVDSTQLCSPSLCHYYAFRKAVLEKKLRAEHGAQVDSNDYKRLLTAEARNRSDESLKAFMRLFLFHVGTPTWERTFGKFWDEAWNKESTHGK